MDRVSNGHGSLNGHGGRTRDSRAAALSGAGRRPRVASYGEKTPLHVAAKEAPADAVVPVEPPFVAFLDNPPADTGSSDVPLSEPAIAVAGSAGIETADAPGPAGTLDGFDPSGRLSGWAWAPGARPSPLTVRILEGETLLGEAKADLARPDVAEAGYGSGVCGFVAPMPHALFDGVRRTLVLQMLDEAAQTVASLHREIVFPNLIAQPAVEIVAAPRKRPVGSGPEIYVPGQVVFGGRHGNADAFHTEGWGEPDESHARVVGPDAAIEMIMRRPDDAYTLDISLTADPALGETQAVTLFFNHFRLGYYELVAGGNTITARLPAELFTLRRATLTLHCPARPPVRGAARLGVSSWCIR